LCLSSRGNKHHLVLTIKLPFGKLHPSQQTTALHPSEGRRTEGGKGPASRWRSATQMFWLLLAAGGCTPRWAPSDRTGRPGSCSLAGWVNKAPSRVVATHKRPSVALVSTALPLDGMCIRNIERPREVQTLGLNTGVRQTGMPRKEKPTAQAA
jgi:hypothetical protein